MRGYYSKLEMLEGLPRTGARRAAERD